MPEMKYIAVIAQEFSTPGNCGALARVMANFGVNKLILVNPKCDYKSKEALDRARHAKKILFHAKVCRNFEEAVQMFDYTIATTAQTGTDYNITRSPLSPKELALKINLKRSYAIVIGRENSGMTNEEIRMCDFTVTIPSFSKYKTLNVSHAAAIILYEIYSSKSYESSVAPVGRIQKEKLVSLINTVIDSLEFKTEESCITQHINWKKFIGKAMLTRREAQSLFGFFKKVKTLIGGIQSERK